MPTDITQVVATLGVVGEALGVGDATKVMPKKTPASPAPSDPCLDEESSKISHENHAIEHNIRQNLESRR